MKIKAQLLFDATLLVSQIIRENRPMPQKGSYRLARLHARLLPEFQTLSTQRDAMVAAYGWTNAEGAVAVPAEKQDEFVAQWTEIGGQEIEVEVEALPLSQFDLGPSVPGVLSAAEIVALGDLITDG